MRAPAHITRLPPGPSPGTLAAMRIATFNVQNLRLRTGPDGPRLDGARDADDPGDDGPAAAALDPADRRLTAAVLARADADIVVLQEVFDRATLDHFHDAFLLPAGLAPYPHRIAMRGNDGHGRNLAVLSRHGFDRVTSHADAPAAAFGLAPLPGRDPAQPVFRRDLLMLEIGDLVLFACHLKAPWPDPAAAWPARRQEAQALRRVIEGRFADPAAALWLILGDLNEPHEEPRGDRAATPILPPFSVDLLDRLPEPERWTYATPGGALHARPDAMLASAALARRWPAARPRVLRAGLGREAGAAGPALPGTGWHRPHASDHAALVIDLPGP